jgi:hypothetical protein
MMNRFLSILSFCDQNQTADAKPFPRTTVTAAHDASLILRLYEKVKKAHFRNLIKATLGRDIATLKLEPSAEARIPRGSSPLSIRPDDGEC